MKKILSLLLAMGMTITMLAGCGTQTSNIENGGNENKKRKSHGCPMGNTTS